MDQPPPCTRERQHMRPPATTPTSQRRCRVPLEIILHIFLLHLILSIFLLHPTYPIHEDDGFGRPVRNDDFQTILAQRLAAHGVNPNPPALPLQSMDIEALRAQLRNPNLHQELIDQERQ